MTTQLKENWLGKYIPRTMDSLTEYEKLIWEAQSFERTLQSISWTQENVLHEWCLRAGEWWGKQHKVDVLERVREILNKGGVFPYGMVTASPGALEYEDVSSLRNGSLSDWTWDEDWGGSPPMSRASTMTTRQKQRHSSTTRIPRTYECTAISSPLLTLLGSLIHEYTHLPNMHIIASAHQIYPTILREVFTLFRAAGTLFRTIEIETPIRLINDCIYLSGEMGLIALGLGHMGFNEITSVLEEVGQTMDLCAVSWRERYLVKKKSLVDLNTDGVLGKCTNGINATSSSCRRIYFPI
jgi:hypothetical protein